MTKRRARWISSDSDTETSDADSKVDMKSADELDVSCDVTFNIHVLESAPVLIYRFVVSELPISSLKI